MNRRVLFTSVVTSAIASAVTLAQEAKKDTSQKKTGQKKTSSRFNQPTGYSDTPVLPGQKWKVHDIDRPKPALVTPGASVGAPPSDAVVLLDGKDLSHWTFKGKRDQPKMNWKLNGGAMEVQPGAGDAVSKEAFGDAQYHVEWSSPAEISGDSQWRANSGILVMGQYEIQVLDSLNNPTYADGQAGAIYGQWPPLVNPARKAGEWNVYDLVFEVPKFEGEKMIQPAFVTLFFNGVLVHNRKEVTGRMAHRVVGTYKAHEAELPLALQDHDVPVRYRNIWVRRLKPYDAA